MRLSTMFCTTLIIMLFSFISPDNSLCLYSNTWKMKVSCYHSKGSTVDGLYAVNCWFRNCRSVHLDYPADGLIQLLRLNLCCSVGIHLCFWLWGSLQVQICVEKLLNQYYTAQNANFMLMIPYACTLFFPWTCVQISVKKEKRTSQNSFYYPSSS